MADELSDMTKAEIAAGKDALQKNQKAREEADKASGGETKAAEHKVEETKADTSKHTTHATPNKK